MSIVVNVITKYKSYLVSDGRLTNPLTNEVMDENTQKIFSINANVDIGAAGDKGLAMAIIDAVRESSEPQDDVEVISDKVISIAKCLYPKFQCSARFIIAGFDSSRTIQSVRITVPEFSKEINTCESDNGLCFNCLFCKEPQNSYAIYYKKYLGNQTLSHDQKILMSIIEYISDAANNDSSINKNISYHII